MQNKELLHYTFSSLTSFVVLFCFKFHHFLFQISNEYLQLNPTADELQNIISQYDK